MSSSTLCDTEALLDEEGSIKHVRWADDDSDEGAAGARDHITQYRSFIRNVRLCRSVLGVFLLLSLVLEGISLSDSLELPFLPNSYDGARAQASLLGFIISLGLCLFFITTAVQPLKRDGDSQQIQNLDPHRSFCSCAFYLLFIALTLHALPPFFYTLHVHHAPPLPLDWVPVGRTISLLGAWIAAGCMRRGPKMAYEPPRLGTGFGLSRDPKKSVLAEVGEEESNVFDRANCALFDFCLLTYSAGTLRKSMSVPSLSLGDLPYLDELRRRSGYKAAVFESDSTLGADGQPRRVGSWDVVKALYRGRVKDLLISMLLEGIPQLFGYVVIFAQLELIKTFETTRSATDKAYAYLLCGILFLGQSSEVMVSAFASVREHTHLHVPTRMTMSSLLFNKILRSVDARALESESDAETSPDHTEELRTKSRSQILNLLTIDTFTLGTIQHLAWGLPNNLINLAIGVTFMYNLLGVSAFVGIALIPALMPFSFLLGRVIYQLDRAWSQARDARINSVKEMLMSIKVVKLNAFEPFFRRRITNLREEEIKWQRLRTHYAVAFNALAEQTPIVALLVTLAFHTRVLGRPLDPAAAFVCMTIFGRIKSSMSWLPNAFQQLLRTKVALDRVAGYLNQADVDLSSWEESSVDQTSIVVQGVTIEWPHGELLAKEDMGDDRFRLEDVTLDIPEGKLTVVCGPLGAGKTLLLHGLLGEAHVSQGLLLAPRTAPSNTPLNGLQSRRNWSLATWMDNSVAYAPQTAFIRHGTIRDNVLFGQPLWPERYERALWEAGLSGDLKGFADGDLTEVGEMGVTLSGGQKARINLARCLYSRASTVYLDDILSAVDAHTAQFILANCFQGTLLRDRTVILVTHHVELCLPAAEYVVALEHGRVKSAGPALLADLSALEALASPTKSLVDEPHASEASTIRGLNIDLSLDSADMTDEEERPHPTRALYSEEHQDVGRVANSHYGLMLRAAGGWWYWLIFALVIAAAKHAHIWQNYTVEKWTQDDSPANTRRYLLPFAASAIYGVVVGTLRWVVLYGVGNVGFYARGSRVIHAQLLDKVMSATLGWFESTPRGRLLNVFGQDVYNLDALSADAFGRTAMSLVDVIASLGAIVYSTPSLVFFLVVFGVPLYYLSCILGKMRADLRRIESKASSPLISLYNDAIDGVVMIRAFGSSRVMMASMNALMNRERVATLSDWTCYNWMRATVQTLTSGVVTATAFLLVGRDDVSAAKAGFVLSFAVRMAGVLFHTLQKWSDLEMNFVHAERVNHYIQMPVMEKTGEGVAPPDQWPSRGHVAVRDLSVRYADDLPDVLHGISFEIEPGQRVGLVGSTGSGKSTLATTLFRTAPYRGQIIIDGIDIATLPLDQLRARLNMVVQDGTLTSGTLRESLDVTGDRDDYEVYEALKRVHLLSQYPTEEEKVTNPFANLDTYVAIGKFLACSITQIELINPAEGANFSQGQRQLLCLARALLKNSKILVMDEATSSVDFEMDAKITQTIKECFADTTMLVIAHRLATIMHYDKVLVLEKGRVLEYGRPVQLMLDEGSAFRALCRAQGEEEYEKLLAMAHM